MNGTCNYILDNMTRQGLNYDDVLKQAQALGYAEADPSTDVDGIDTWHKAILSANIAFGVSLDKGTVPVAGIRNIKAEDVENFKAHGLVCKLIATGKRENGVISAYVQPTLVKDGEPEAAVPMNYNLITFIGETSQRMSFFGQGAGRYPTAYNVVPGSGGRSCREGVLRPLRRPCGGCERREADMVRSRQLERRDKGALGQRGGDRAGIRCRNARMAERESQRIRRGNSRMTESDREEQKMKVVKFGGSSMADAGQYRKVRDILLADPERRVVVVSAAGKRFGNDHKLTDLLYLCYAHVQYGVDCSSIFDMIASRYLDIRDELGLDLALEPELEALKKRIDAKEVTQEELVSRGEYFSAKLMAAYLGFQFVDAADWVMSTWTAP